MVRLIWIQKRQKFRLFVHFVQKTLTTVQITRFSNWKQSLHCVAYFDIPKGLRVPNHRKFFLWKWTNYHQKFTSIHKKDDQVEIIRSQVHRMCWQKSFNEEIAQKKTISNASAKISPDNALSSFSFSSKIWWLMGLCKFRIFLPIIITKICRGDVGNSRFKIVERVRIF